MSKISDINHEHTSVCELRDVDTFSAAVVGVITADGCQSVVVLNG